MTMGWQVENRPARPNTKHRKPKTPSSKVPPMNVSIIGGGGLVGSCAAFALQCAGIVREIALIDVTPELVGGQALDLLHGSCLVADQKIFAAETAEVKHSDVIIITAGLRRKPDESRLDLINRNVELF